MKDAPDQVFEAALAGDPAPLVAVFAEGGQPATDLLRRLLDAPRDAPVAACFARMWPAIGPDMPDGEALCLRWYIKAEAGVSHPLRAAVHRDALARLLFLDCLPQSDLGFDLVFSAVRTATDRPAPVALHARANAVLERAAQAWLADPEHPATPSLLYAAIGALHLGVLRDALGRAETHPRDRALDHAIDWSLSALIANQGGVDDATAARIRREFERDPESPAAAQRFVWLGLREGQRFADLVHLLHAMRQDRAEPHMKPALFFAYAQARENELEADEARFAHRLEEIVSDWVPDEKRDIIATRSFTPEPAPGADLAALLDHARGLTEVDLNVGAENGPAAVRAAFMRVADAVPTAQVPDEWTLLDFLQAGESLRQLARREFGWVSHFIEAPQAQGRPEYGWIDLHMLPAITDGLFAASAAFCRAGWDWVEAGHPILAAWTLGRLLHTHVQTAGKIGETQASLDLLDRVGRYGIMPELLDVLRDELRLEAGDTSQGPPPPVRRGSTVHPYLARPEWSAAEGIDWRSLVDDAAIEGTFDVVWPDGRVETFAHATPARSIGLAGVREAALLGEGLIIGPAGHMLKPDHYHTSKDYPMESRVVLAGQGGAVRIRPLSEARIREPVLLLDACAALHWPNYYHWMVPHLSRLALAEERGLLAGRRLVLPRGLRPWMLETLDLIGITPERRLELPFGQLTRFADAAILGSIEHASPAAVAALRRAFLGPAAGATAPPEDGPLIYLSRGNLRDRKLDNERRIEATAAEMGFDIVRPEELSVAGQAELFSRARAIAGPEGAAMTNTLFAAPGARVLSILCVNEMLPIFNDLSLVLGHRHRKLAGKPASGPGAGSRFQPRYGIEPGHARAALEWAKGEA